MRLPTEYALIAEASSPRAFAYLGWLSDAVDVEAFATVVWSGTRIANIRESFACLPVRNHTSVDGFTQDPSSKRRVIDAHAMIYQSEHSHVTGY